MGRLAPSAFLCSVVLIFSLPGLHLSCCFFFFRRTLFWYLYLLLNMFWPQLAFLGSRDSLLVRAPDLGSKGFKFESQQERWENFFLQCQLWVTILIQCPFHPHVTAVACKTPRSFCQKCSWQGTSKHAYAFDPMKSEWADYASVQAYCGNLSGNELTCNSSGNIRSQSSQLAEPLWTDPGIKNGISVRKLISTPKKNILPKSSQARKSHHTALGILQYLPNSKYVHSWLGLCTTY